MNLAAPASSPFVKAVPLEPRQGAAPELRMLRWNEEPTDTRHLVTVRYHGTTDDGRSTRFSVSNDSTFGGDLWYGVTGSIDDAIRAARDLAVIDGETEDPAGGVFARTSVAVLEAGQGVWHLQRLNYTEGLGDGMDAIISMPIDPVPASKTHISVPYGEHGAKGFDAPDKVMVRFNDERVAALVGVDQVVLAPRR